MPDYFVTFTAHVDERKRPENFPKQVHIHETFKEIESQQQLAYAVNERFVKLATQAGLVVFKDESEPIDSKLTFDQRMFIPWHMLTHMHLDVGMIINQKPTELDSIASGEPNEPTKETIH